jgi:hypothetical protein
VSPTPRDFVEEARRWTGTPFHHQGRSLGVGVDCIGLPAEAARAVGLPVLAPADYGRDEPIERIVEALEAVADPVERGSERDGDLSLFLPHHLTIKTDRGYIHAWQAASGRGKVFEGRLPPAIVEQWHSSWRLRGLA